MYIDLAVATSHEENPIASHKTMLLITNVNGTLHIQANVNCTFKQKERYIVYRFFTYASNIMYIAFKNRKCTYPKSSLSLSYFCTKLIISKNYSVYSLISFLFLIKKIIQCRMKLIHYRDYRVKIENGKIHPLQIYSFYKKKTSCALKRHRQFSIV
jgi:hypothetical protein